MDRMGANFLKVVGQIKPVWARTRFRCSWQLVLKKVSPALLTGENESHQLERCRPGVTFEYEDIPADMQDRLMNGTRT